MTVKKFLCALLSFVLVLSFCACSEKETPPATTAGQPSAPAQTTESTPTETTDSPITDTPVTDIPDDIYTPLQKEVVFVTQKGSGNRRGITTTSSL